MITGKDDLNPRKRKLRSRLVVLLTVRSRRRPGPCAVSNTGAVFEKQFLQKLRPLLYRQEEDKFPIRNPSWVKLLVSQQGLLSAKSSYPSASVLRRLCDCRERGSTQSAAIPSSGVVTTSVIDRERFRVSRARVIMGRCVTRTANKAYVISAKRNEFGDTAASSALCWSRIPGYTAGNGPSFCGGSGRSRSMAICLAGRGWTASMALDRQTAIRCRGDTITRRSAHYQAFGRMEWEGDDVCLDGHFVRSHCGEEGGGGGASKCSSSCICGRKLEAGRHPDKSLSKEPLENCQECCPLVETRLSS
ncbi:hypothetical protein DFJ77DRAFT_258159 [Powellomyces hirtus]|nr:hypothetical protein DFJ77DRAFT_258159 [Powellomyces hirtus]